MVFEWDAQKLLDQYILDYMIRNNMTATAQRFITEANVTPDPPDLNPDPEGFLLEWWSFFWAIFTSTLQNSSGATPRYFPPIDVPEFHNLPQTVDSTMTSPANMAPGNSSPTAMPTPEPNPNSSETNTVNSSRVKDILNSLDGGNEELPPIPEAEVDQLATSLASLINPTGSEAADPIANETAGMPAKEADFVDLDPEPSETAGTPAKEADFVDLDPEPSETAATPAKEPDFVDLDAEPSETAGPSASASASADPNPVSSNWDAAHESEDYFDQDALTYEQLGEFSGRFFT